MLSLYCLFAGLFCGHFLVTGAAEAPERCRDGYVYYSEDRTCIKFVRERFGKTWDDARESCQAEDGDLVTINSAAKNQFITDNLNSMRFFWIGARNRDPDGFDFYLTNGEKMTYSNWTRGQPDNVNHNEHCVLIYSDRYTSFRGGWSDFHCSFNMNYVCQRPMNGLCGEGYSLFEGDDTCVKVVDHPLPWDQAREHCRADNGDLMMVDTAQKNRFVTEMVDTFQSYWIGVRSTDTDGQRRFSYSDGEALTYTNWREGQPGSAHDKHCVSLFGSLYSYWLSGRWGLSTCTSRLAYVCQKKISGSCPKGGWIHSPSDDTCVKVFESRTYFNFARATCQRHPGGDLVVIRDGTKNDLVKENIGTNDYYWIGVKNQDADGGLNLKYVDGTSLGSYHPWVWGRSDNNRGREECIAMVGPDYNRGRSLGKWNNYPCISRFPFVCEVPSP